MDGGKDLPRNCTLATDYRGGAITALSTMTAWARDVEVESTPLSTTGGHTWKAAYCLADYLAAVASELGLTAEGVKVLELGAGTGWLGVTVARNLPAAALVCLTEQEGGLHWLRHNVELNRQRGLPLGNVAVQACDWLEFGAPGQQPRSSTDSGSESRTGAEPQPPSTQPVQQQPDAAQDCVPAAVPPAPASPPASSSHPPGSPAAAGGQAPRSVRWDFILGSDLIYNEIGSRCLPRVLAALAGPSTVVLYCHTKHRYDLLDLEFFETLEACGLQCQEVWEPAAPEPPESPPLQFPPVDLFPEQRIAVYQITQKQAA